jgi:cytochrome c peroxidase
VRKCSASTGSRCLHSKRSYPIRVREMIKRDSMINKIRKALGILLCGFLVGCQTTKPSTDSTSAPSPVVEARAQGAMTDEEKSKLQKTANALFKPLPEYMAKEPSPPEMIDLGRMLYYEKRLSKDRTISCNSCHNLQTFGVDGEATSPGVAGQRGGRNSPTVYNAALHITQFWDGRSPHVEDQASGPMLNPVEMSMEKDLVEKRLRSIPEYRERFSHVFGDKSDAVTIENAATAIGAFERGLVTPGPFDSFMEGDLAALNEEQAEGLKLFVDTGCASCHTGPALGGKSYQTLGVKKPYETEDLGRFEVTHKDSDKKKFKVPGLRNIAETGPYFHDGSVKTLQESIALMAEHQLDKSLTEEDVVKIEIFLGSLTGNLDNEYIKEPMLPPDGNENHIPED